MVNFFSAHKAFSAALVFFSAISVDIYSADCYKNSSTADKTPNIYRAIVELKQAVDDRVRQASLFKPDSPQFSELVGEVRGICLALKKIELAIHGNDCVSYIVEVEIVEE